MSFDATTPNEGRLIRAAQLRRRVGSACTEMLLSLALIASICAVALIAGTGAASAAVRNLVIVDDGISFGAIFAVVGIVALLLMLAPFACSGLTPNYVRRRRERR